jgi:flagellar basal-body rod modification protein FlgD
MAIGNVGTPSSAGIPVSGASAASTSNGQSSTAFDFLQLIVEQLKNQSPMDPSNSDQMVQQMAMMQMTQETHTLDTNMQSWAQQQGLANSAGLIGRTVAYLDSAGTQQVGAVQGVKMVSGQAQIVINGSPYPISQIVGVQ